jgi:hypothetical protein
MFGREVRSDMVVVNSLFNIVYNFASYGLLDINKAFEGWVSGLLCSFGVNTMLVMTMAN